MVVRGFIDYYIFGKSVDSAHDLIIESLSKGRSDEYQRVIAQYKTPTKVALCWCSCSAVLSLATSTLLSPAVGTAVGVLGTVPFVKPLLSSVTSHIVKCYRSFSVPQKVLSVTTVAAFSLAEYGILRANGIPSRNYVPIALLLSNLPVDASLLATTEFQRRNAEANAKVSPNERSPLSKRKPAAVNHSGNAASNSPTPHSRTALFDAVLVQPKPSANVIVSNRRKEAEAEIAKYEVLLKKIQTFIASKPDLAELCAEFMVLDKDNVAISPTAIIGSLNSKDEVDVMTQLKIKANTLKHNYEECLLFIQRNDAVAAAFQKHIDADPQATRALQEFTSNQQPVVANASASKMTIVEENDDKR